METDSKAMVMASFLGDTLALGAHWIYDTDKIYKLFGRVDSLLKPRVDSYHPKKDKGDFTHYGDQTFVLLESVAARRGFDLEDFSDRWRSLFEDYNGYIDQATSITLSKYAAGNSAGYAGSQSDDFAGASRIAPLVYCYRKDLGNLVKNTRSQTIMTHNNPLTIDSTEFFARVSWSVLNSTNPVEAMKQVSYEHFRESPLSTWVYNGIESKDTESLRAILRFGQSCHTQEAFPSTVHLIARYERDLKEALVQSVMAGGDSAARNMMTGMVLGASLGPESLPKDWLDNLKKRDDILKLLTKIN